MFMPPLIRSGGNMKIFFCQPFQLLTKRLCKLLLIFSFQMQRNAEIMPPPKHYPDRKSILLAKLPWIIEHDPGKAEIVFSSRNFWRCSQGFSRKGHRLLLNHLTDFSSYRTKQMIYFVDDLILC